MPAAQKSTGQTVRDRDYPLGRVPRAERPGTLAVAVVIAGFLFYTPTMVVGGDVAGAFPFGEFLGLAAVATVVLGLYMALMGLISERTGLTTALVSRLVLGRVGGKWGSFILGGTQLGWYGVGLGVLANLIEASTGFGATWLVVIVGGVLMASTAYFGFRGIEILSWISVPLMLVLCVWVTVLAFGEAGGWSDLLAGGGADAGSIGPGTAITMMIATFISGGTQIGNWTRFANGATRTFVLTLVAVLLVQFAMLFFGGVGVAAYGEGDFVEVLLAMGIVGMALVLLVANLWTTNDNTAYAFAVAGAELFEKADKRPFVVGGVVISVVLALTGIADNLISFLSLLSVVIPPLGGVIIGTFFFVWRGKDPGTALTDIPMIRLGALVAYLAGAAAALVGTYGGLGSPAIQGIIVAALAVPVCETVARTMRA
ncbi:cytosine permease [Bogoriella caseilytica]|uniref:Purine-cytosine permease-like protein n=1 Tax=Bogoriella caseilytica TaxID=56055 RepID=A0A3N2BCU6_9MICO|nr:cytosine permease [Bogoriella caseilytica]ROR73042.1 purine-cytosine permease-like protein [Bogoriella caseilytica]